MELVDGGLMSSESHRCTREGQNPASYLIAARFSNAAAGQDSIILRYSMTPRFSPELHEHF
jgi:hypothetical protein